MFVPFLFSFPPENCLWFKTTGPGLLLLLLLLLLQRNTDGGERDERSE